MVKPVCDVVLPCRDEAAALPSLLESLPPGFRPIVVDNGSRDDTAAVATASGATVVHEDVPGYGAAVHAGVAASTAPYLAVADGDGSFDLAELAGLLALVANGSATMAVGRRRPTERGVWPWHARAANALVAWWLRATTPLTVHDIAPMRVCRRCDLLDLGVRDRGFGYPLELLLRAARERWRVVELDVHYRARAEGTRSKVSGSARGTLRAARDFARVMT
ncbi:MAG: glycosyltransferase [Actinomycetota bacterium]|nr:glycosyltransferase [Actinomycetota bacterium]